MLIQDTETVEKIAALLSGDLSWLDFQAFFGDHLKNIGEEHIEKLASISNHLDQNEWEAVGIISRDWAASIELDCQIKLELAYASGRFFLSGGLFSESNKSLLNALDIATHLKDDAVLSNIYNVLAGANFSMGNLLPALQMLNQSANLKGRLNDPLGEVKVLINIGRVLIEIGSLENALERLTHCHKIIKANNLSLSLEIRCLINIGICNERLGWWVRAKKIYEDVRHLAYNTGDFESLIVTQINTGNIVVEKNDVEGAMVYFTSALEQSVSHNYPQFQADALEGLSAAHLALNQHSEAFDFASQALELSRHLSDHEGESDALIAQAKARMAASEYARAVDDLHASLELSEQAQRPSSEAEAHRLLSESFEAMNDLRSALKHLREQHRLEKHLFNEASEKRTAALSIQFDLERAQHETETYRLRTELETSARARAEDIARERTAELEQAQAEIVNRLALAAEYRDDMTGEHTLRVGRYAAAVARRMGWQDSDVRLMQQAARLHDVGKIGIPDAILLKPGKLSEAEYEFMKSHTAIGGRILSGGHSRLVRMSETIAVSHHERWDGQGYPHGLAGEAIPLEGRIVAVADVFDALRQERPYKKAWTRHDAIAEVRRSSGSQFDPRVVECFVQALEESVDDADPNQPA